MQAMDRQEYVMGIKGMIKLYEVILENRCRDLGLNLLELNILNFLFYNPEKNTASDIVEYRMLPKANVSKGIDSLVRKGYVRREEDASDRRRTNLYLLSAAEPITQAIDGVRTEYFEKLFNGFTDYEQQEYFRLCKMIHGNVRRLLKEENKSK